MNEQEIISLHGRRIWDSRGRPTVEAEVTLAGGAIGRGIAPAGASRGSAEAVDLRDGGDTVGGFGIEKALAGLNNTIATALVGMEAADQSAIDSRLLELDTSPTKEKLGGNAMIAVSLAVLHAAAAAAQASLWQYVSQGKPVRLPLPEIQIFGGGAHADQRVDIQDFMVMPLSANTFAEALEMTAEVYLAAGRLMSDAGKRAGVADEGGWWPDFDTNEAALDMLVRSIEAADLTPGDDMGISLDVAASEFHQEGLYRLGLEAKEYDSDGLIELLGDWLDRYPIVSVEDPLAEDDHTGMKAFTNAYGSRVQIIGDDYLVTNAGRVEAAATDRICNAALIKLNQAGTVTETKAAVDAARAAGWGTIVSARSGETEDTTISHLAVGWNAGQIKVGSFARSERMAKWNEVLRIEEALGDQGVFAGRGILS